MSIPFTPTSTASPAKAIGKIGRRRNPQQGWKLIPATLCFVSLWWTTSIHSDISSFYTLDARDYPAQSYGLIRRKYDAKEMATTLPHTPLVAGVSFDEVFNDKWNNVPYYDRTPSPRLPIESEWLLIPHRHNNGHDHDETSLETIPKILHKMYFQHDGHFQDIMNKTSATKGDMNLIKALESWHSNNPGYLIQYFDMTTARKYLQQYFHPVFLRTFDCLQAYAAKSDLFRFALLYREGGWYSDWKQTCLQPGLLDRLSNGTDFFVTKDNGHKGVIAERCVTNAFVGSRPFHPVIGKDLELIVSNVQKRNFGKTPIHPTGPCALGQALQSVTGRGGYDAISGEHKELNFFLNGTMIVQGKCDDCGMNQDWKHGNNYNTLWNNKAFFCEDAAVIFDA
jgi:mannosyltransferase OCH1-like enzyme